MPQPFELLSITCHYVDEEEKYTGGIYPISPKRLAKQLDIVRERYTFVAESDLILAIRGEKSLPPRSCILTFDDGLRSQYENALPILEARNIPAIFFIPTGHLEGRAYTLHKIHFLLSKVPSETLLSEAESAYRGIAGKPIDWGKLDVQKITAWYRYDSSSAAKLKFLLNHHLDQDLVEVIVGELFKNLSQINEEKFCEMFYMNETHMRTLSKLSFVTIGLHTHDHLSITGRSKELVSESIKKNWESLNRVLGVSPRGISYPFGMISEAVFSEKVKDVADELGLEYGFSIEKKINRDFGNRYLLGRFNPNDISGGSRPLFSFT